MGDTNPTDVARAIRELLMPLEPDERRTAVYDTDICLDCGWDKRDKWGVALPCYCTRDD